MVSRRGFLQRLGLGVAAIAVAPVLPRIAPAAPLFVPPARLDMGVPRAILTASGMPLGPWLEPVVTGAWAGSVPMLLVHDEFQPPGWQQFGRPRVPAGTTLMVDRATAERWIGSGVGTAGPLAPLDLQEASAQRWAAKRAEYGRRVSHDTFSLFVGRSGVAPVDLTPVWSAPVPASVGRARSDAFDRMVQRATAKARGQAGPDWWDTADAS